MTGMVANTADALDDGRHAGQGPQFRTEAVRQSALAQGGLHPLQLTRIQKRLPAGAQGCVQGGAARLLPLTVPTGYAHAAHLELASHGSLCEVALGEQARCLFAATFESFEVTADALDRHGP